jgi:polysaccharide export outer membrane protein
VAAFVLATGCQTPPTTNLPPPVANAASSNPEVLVLKEGDEVRITFPGAPNLDTTQRVRTDGRITMSLVGEVVVSGLTPSDLEKKLLELYSTQLVSKEVSVTVISSSFTVFVTGAVLRPGKVVTDHPITALEAVMEAGGFDSTKADMQSVKIIRKQDGGTTKNYSINLKQALESDQGDPVVLKRGDILYVPERFSWF